MWTNKVLNEYVLRRENEQRTIRLRKANSRGEGRITSTLRKRCARLFYVEKDILPGSGLLQSMNGER